MSSILQPNTPLDLRTFLSIDDFTAIDVETANRDRDSLCALALVRVVQGKEQERFYQLIHPQTSWFEYGHIHGISSDMVASAPTLAACWDDVQRCIHDTKYFVAHNAVFEQSVFQAIERKYPFTFPKVPWLCTLSWSKRLWTLKSYSLDALCKQMAIPLLHHHALSDALACASLLLRMQAQLNQLHQL